MRIIHHRKKIITGIKRCVSIGLLFISLNVFSQDNLNVIKTSFDQYYQHNIQEKIFVHTDKSFYLAGEILWFKLYITDATYHKPLDLSKVAYIEVLDSANTALLEAKIAINKGDGSGSFYLPLTLNSGNYKLRAYTNWMKNYNAEGFFEKMIPIVNVQKVTPTAVKTTDENYDVHFFPEGGNLVNGLQSKVAFKVTDENGEGTDASGAVIDDADTIAKFASIHKGMGNFLFKPMADHSYKAYIKTTTGKTFMKDLPNIYTNGCVMNVSSNDDNVKVQIQSTIPGENEVYLLVHSGLLLKVAQRGLLQNGNIDFNFPASQLEEGISSITVFNSNKQPLCERLYFKKPVADMEIDAAADQSEYGTRKKVSIDISGANLKENDSANLSMSVYRLDSIQSIDNNTIETYFLLTSALKGYIEDAQYYFEGNKEADIDNLLLVNGWRRFNWENVPENKKPLFSFAPEYNGHIISGKITDSETGAAIKDAETYLSVPGSKTQFVSSISDSAGNVRFEMKDFYGGSEVIVQTKNKDAKYKISIDNPFSDNYSSFALPAFTLPKKYPNTLLLKSISMQVQNIYATNKLKQFYQPNVDTAAFYLHADARYSLDDYTRFTTIEEVLREYVTMVNVNRRNGRYHLPVFDKGHDVMFQDDPLVLLDAVPVSDLNKFMNFDPYKLKSLEVVNTKYFYGESTFNGILNWKTFTGDLANYDLDPNAVVINYEGLQLEREFYSPSYSDIQVSHIPDFRNVLYWMPEIKITSAKKRTINFYTSDIPGQYAIVIQGISSRGSLGSVIKKFEVKKQVMK